MSLKKKTNLSESIWSWCTFCKTVMSACSSYWWVFGSLGCVNLNRGRTHQDFLPGSWWSGWRPSCRSPSAWAPRRLPTWQRSPCAGRGSSRRWWSWQCSSSPPWTSLHPRHGSEPSFPRPAGRPWTLDAIQQWWSARWMSRKHQHGFNSSLTWGWILMSTNFSASLMSSLARTVTEVVPSPTSLSWTLDISTSTCEGREVLTKSSWKDIILNSKRRIWS